jgi:tetratricopeptide (TPR) repeat protein
VGYRFEEASDHWNLARILTTCGQWNEAKQELSVFLDMSTQDRILQMQGAGWAIHSQRSLLMAREEAVIDARKSNNEYRITAIEFAQRALELADETTKSRFPHPREYIRAYWLLGAAYSANNELTLAEENLSKALSLCRQINLVEMEADILLDLARFRYKQDKYEEAKSLAEEALTITERSGYVLQGADVNLFLAQYALEQEKDKAKAKQYAEEARKLATCDGPPYYYKVAYEEAERFLENLGG